MITTLWVPTLGEQEIVMERQFNAPRMLMFQVFTEPEHLKRWWAPPPYTFPVCTIDLRPTLGAHRRDRV